MGTTTQTTINNTEVEALVSRLRAMCETLPPTQQAILAELLVAAGEGGDVEGFGLNGMRAAAVAVAVTAAAALGIAGVAGGGSGGGSAGGTPTEQAAPAAVTESAPQAQVVTPAAPAPAAPKSAPTPKPSGPDKPGKDTYVVVTTDQTPPPKPDFHVRDLGDDVRRPDQNTTTTTPPKPPQEDDRKQLHTESMPAPGDAGTRYLFDVQGDDISKYYKKADPNAKPDPRATSEVTRVRGLGNRRVLVTVTFTNTADHHIRFTNTLRLHMFDDANHDQLQESDLRNVTLAPGETHEVTLGYDLPKDGRYSIWLETM